MVVVKGNDGKAMKHERIQTARFMMKVAAAVLVAVIVWAYWYANNENDNPRINNGKILNSRLGENLNSGASETVSIKDTTRLEQILKASVQLVDLHVSKLITNDSSPTYYDGIEAEFCTIDWEIYKRSPWKAPMYRDLVSKSHDCRNNRFVMNLKNLMEEVYHFDQQISISSSARTRSKKKVALQPNFIFHESKCGSTALANMLSYSNPDETIVYSEAGPPLSALKICGDGYTHCSMETAATIFRDVVYLLSRERVDVDESASASVSRLFFKMQSTAILNIDIVQQAFPEAPWIFVYRDPEEVLVSHLGIRHVERAKCLQYRRHPSKRIVDFLDQERLRLKDLSNEEFCAIYLSSICSSALEAIKTHSLGRALNYDNLVNDFISILANHFGINLSSREIKRMELASKRYSKSRDEDLVWVEDSTDKHNRATDAIMQASNNYLAFSYIQLKDMQH